MTKLARLGEEIRQTFGIDLTSAETFYKTAQTKTEENAPAPEGGSGLVSGAEKVLGEGVTKAIKGLAGGKSEVVGTPVVDTIRVSAQGPDAERFVGANRDKILRIIKNLSAAGRM